MINKIIMKLRNLVDESVRANICEGILLSGGLDTSILAAIASGYAKLDAFTIGFKDSYAPDIEYSKLASKKFNLNHIIYQFNEEELYNAIPCTIRITKSFDPMEIRNSLVIFIGLRLAKEYGIGSIMTGDGSDELFAGYSFLFGFERNELNKRLKKLWNSMQFSSPEIGRAVGIMVKLPYLDNKLKKFAAEIDPELKTRKIRSANFCARKTAKQFLGPMSRRLIRAQSATKSLIRVKEENGNLCGKWILRKAFEDILPGEIAWRIKTPIEYGSGTSILPKIFNKKISDMEFHKKIRIYLNEGVKIRDKEHLYYYEIYRGTFGGILPPKEGEAKCRGCGGGLPLNNSHCRICGEENAKT